MAPDAPEVLFGLQLLVPSLLLVLLVASFLPRSAQSATPQEGHEEIAGIIPVILPITLPRVKLLVSLLLLLSLSHVVSLTWMLVLFNGDPPTISLFTAVGGSLAWAGAAYSVWKAAGKRVGWAKAMGWVGLIGEAWMGSERVWLFVKWTGDYPPGSFPLPAFLHLTLLSVRLLLLVLVLWALYNPVRDFIPAPRRRNENGRSDERQSLLGGQEREGSSSTSKDAVAGEGEGYGTFGEAGEEQRIEGRGSPSTTSASQKAASPTETPLPEPASAESLVPITAPSPSPEEVEVEVENPIESITPPQLSPVDEGGSDAASSSTPPPPPPAPILPPNADEPLAQPSFADVVASNAPTADSSAPSAPFPKPNSLLFPSESLPTTDSPRSTTPTHDNDPTPPAPIPSSPATQQPPAHMSPSASSTVTAGTAESPSVSTKEKRKRLSSLSDMGRKMSDEGKGLVRRVSLMGRKGSSSNVNASPSSPSSELPGGRASPSPMNSPAGRNSLSGTLPDVRGEGDGASSFVSTGSGGGLKKRLSLLTRKSSTSSSAPPAEAQTPSSSGGEAQSSAGTGAPKETKKKPFVTKNGRNGKGKKTKKK